MEDGFNQEELEAEGVNEVEYAEGFNWGYVIAEHNPTLAMELMDGVEMNSDRNQGLYHGCNEFFREREQSRLEELGKLRDSGKDRDKDMER